VHGDLPFEQALRPDAAKVSVHVLGIVQLIATDDAERDDLVFRDEYTSSDS
jgi:hypothetical protein